MKHKLLHFKSILCSLGILLLLIGCQNDEGKHAHNENLKVQKVSLAEIPAIKDVLELKSRTVAARSNGETNYFAYANPENVYVYTDDEGLNTYTFSLSLAEPENQMSNLVIREMPDGTFQYRLMRYESDEMAAWKQDIASGIKPTATVRISSEILEAPLQRGGGACDTFVTDFTCPSGMHNGWSRSECVHEFYTWSTKVTVMSLDCGREEGGGGAGPGSGGGFVSVPNAPVNLLANFVSGLSDAQNRWWKDDQNAVAVSVIKDYLNRSAYMESSKIFSRWAIDYFRLHSNTTVEQFNSWFMKPSEGRDGDYDVAFWENPNLSFPQQNLPSWDNFLAAYPSHLVSELDDAAEVYMLVGGIPLNIYNADPNRNNNTCAIRLSRGLNYSGIIIPNIPNKTFLGADGKYYFLGAANMIAWMKKTFGTPTGNNHLISSQAGLNGEGFKSNVIGKQGIYAMLPINSGLSGFQASGHVDLLYNFDCDGGCYFNATGGVKDIYIWELN